MSVTWLLAVAVAVAALAASPARAQSGLCDPLVPEACLYPFPSSFFLRADPVTPTGLRVVFPGESVPADRNGVRFDPSQYSRLDGFSPSTAAIAYFANVSTLASDVPSWWDITRSLRADSPTIFLDADSGELIPHYAELDYTSSDENAFRKAFMMWPTKQLRFGTRYIVAMRNLRTDAGAFVETSAAFRALRDGTPSSDPDVESRRELFEDIFERLAEVGVARGSLQLAWDFTTASREYTTKYIIKARDDAFTRIPAGGPRYTITEVQDNVSDTIFRRIKGTFVAPHYHTRGCRPGCRLVLDEDENPTYQGEADVRFTVNIPRNCVNGTFTPCPILQYGHGLLGGQGEADGSVPSGVANKYGYIIIAVDMWGMCSFDVPSIGQALLNDIADAVSIPDRSVQGVLNHHLAIKMISGSFASDPAVIFNGRSVIDTTRKYYWGISQGGIYGVVVVATSTDIERGHLGVPGGPYPLLLARSVDFDPYYAIIKQRYPDPLDRILLLSLIGVLWDWTEPGGYMGTLNGEYQLGPQPKRIYIDYAKGDAQVSYLGAYMIARSTGAKIFNNNVICRNETSPIYGIQVGASPITSGSVMVGYDFNIACGPAVNLPPPKETDTHSRPRRETTNQDMAHEFFSRGIVTDRCNGQGCYIDTTFVSVDE